MRGQPSSAVCDVVGCAEPPAGSYLDTRAHGGFQFWVCAAHFARLQRGEQPVIVEEPTTAGADVPAPPALIMQT